MLVANKSFNYEYNYRFPFWTESKQSYYVFKKCKFLNSAVFSLKELPKALYHFIPGKIWPKTTFAFSIGCHYVYSISYQI